MTTRKHPRTLQEAFGPNTNHVIHEPLRPIDPQDRIVLWVSAVAVVTFLALLVVGWVQ